MVKFRNVILDVFRAYDPCDLEQLIVVVLSLEEWLFGEHHAGQHAASGPDVQLIVVVMIGEEKLGRFEVA